MEPRGLQKSSVCGRTGLEGGGSVQTPQSGRVNKGGLPGRAGL